MSKTKAKRPSEGSLRRVLKRHEVLAIAFGAMIGWSWIALTGTWIQGAGVIGAMAAFAVGGGALIFVALTYAELASAMPKVGGEHAYSHRALGPTGSFICTWSILLGYVSVVAFEAVALPTVLEYLLPEIRQGFLWTVAGWEFNLTWVLTGAGAAVIMMVINILGIGIAAKLQMLVVTVVLTSGILLLVGAANTGDLSNLSPRFVGGFPGFLSVLVMVPFMFVGFDVIPQSAEEIDLPFAEIGRTIVLSVLIAIVWYVIVIGAVSLGLGSSQRAVSELPTAVAATTVLGAWGGKALVIGGVAGILTSWNAFLIGGSRALYAMAKAGQVPRVFGKLHPRFNTPHRAILLVGCLAIIAPFFGRPALVWLVNAGGLGIVTAYTFVVLSFLVLRVREPAMKRPYRVRNGTMIAAVALLLCLVLVSLYLPWSPSALAWPAEWAIVLGWCALGALFYFLSDR